MKFVLFAVLAVLVAPAFVVSAEEVVLDGEPVDMACYAAGRSGEGHASCAKSCAEGGQPIGFLAIDDEGKETLYLVLGANRAPAKDLMAEHIGMEVSATGSVTEKSGMKILTVSKVESLDDDDDWLPSEDAGAGSIQNQ